MDLKMIFDTGCSHTIVVPRVLDLLSIPLDKLGPSTSIQTANSKESGQLFRVKEFQVLGRKFLNQTLDCHKLPDYFQIDGLLGMDILSQFITTIDPFKKVIAV